MIQKKVCMLGAFAVGKTSLVARYVKGLFSDKYLTTVGVKIDKKIVDAAGQKVCVILWDIHGEDEFQKVRMSYVRGAAGYFMVADGTRRATLDTAFLLQNSAAETLGDVPFIFLVNKADLEDDWEIAADALARLESRGWTVIRTSAKTGQAVEEAFQTLVGRMLEA